MTDNIFQKVYSELYEHYGPQFWWPGDSDLEVVVGALLTQNTNWQNVEKAINQLKKNDLLELEKLIVLDENILAELIRPSGYYNMKAKRLKGLLGFIKQNGGLDELKGIETTLLRQMLLNVEGIGPETADSIILYALGKPIFVVDAYTKRIFSRLELTDQRAGYDEVQRLFHENLPQEKDLFKEYHALIVRHAKERCCKNRPQCKGCPLSSCPSNIRLKL